MATSATATSAPGIKRTILQTLPIPEIPGYESRLVKLEYPTGVKAPIHNHPVAATGYVLEGSVVSQWEGHGGEIEKYTKGDSFIDLGKTIHVQSDNASETESLVMLLSYVIKVGEPNVKLVQS